MNFFVLEQCCPKFLVFSILILIVMRLLGLILVEVSAMKTDRFSPESF
jgi:hypothetical protein